MSKETKIIAMYLPQYHQIPENDRWWGVEGFTDWVSAKNATPLFNGHIQPKEPLNDNYYDLSNVDDIRWQANLAKNYGVYGWGIYHYWFSDDLKLLTKPAELILQNKDIDMPFFFAWDNGSWVRTWSKYTHYANTWSPKFDKDTKEKTNVSEDNGVLAELQYGNEKNWEYHFNYLLDFFKDDRYIKIDNKPVFIIFNYFQKEILQTMCTHWRKLAVKAGFSGLYLISRYNIFDSMPGFDGLFTYEPMFSGWQNKNIVSRIVDKIKEQTNRQQLKEYDYDKVWQKLLAFARSNKGKDLYHGGFVHYDDTPRRGENGRIVLKDSAEKFKHYLSELIDISSEQNKEFVFITAWNEWGEGAYLEPDKENEFKYLEAIRRIMRREEDN